MTNRKLNRPRKKSSDTNRPRSKDERSYKNSASDNKKSYSKRKQKSNSTRNNWWKQKGNRYFGRRRSKTSEGRNRNKYVSKETHSTWEYENRSMRSHRCTNKFMMGIRKGTTRKKMSDLIECIARESITCSTLLQSYYKNMRRITMNLELGNSVSGRKERMRTITKLNQEPKYTHLTSLKSQ